jgi:hypothetical protein
MNTQQEETEQVPQVPVSFRVSTYRKLPKGMHGITHVDSRRLSASEALDLILGQLTDEECTLSSDGIVTTITIDWSKVPMEIRDPFRFGVRR